MAVYREEDYGGPMKLKGYDPEMYEKGYSFAAVRTSYIPDFKSAREKASFEAGLKAGYARREELKKRRNPRAKTKPGKRNPVRKAYAPGPWYILYGKGNREPRFLKEKLRNGWEWTGYFSDAKSYRNYAAAKREFNNMVRNMEMKTSDVLSVMTREEAQRY